jgi:hypothetical protein
MSRIKELKWGQTPFHRMTKKALVLTACRLYAAAVSARSVIGMDKAANEAMGRNMAFYGTDGTGGRSLEMLEQALREAEKGYDQEDIYRSFFRYALDLLFDGSVYRIGKNWMVCPVCGTMLGGRGDGSTVEGQVCHEAYGLARGKCEGVFRRLTWDDLMNKS